MKRVTFSNKIQFGLIKNGVTMLAKIEKGKNKTPTYHYREFSSDRLY